MRLTYPIVDISNAVQNGGNISKVYLWMDVIHRGNDNYQDRYDFVARAGNDPGNLGEYLRESGTALFKDGTITGADYGIEMGGAFRCRSLRKHRRDEPRPRWCVGAWSIEHHHRRNQREWRWLRCFDQSGSLWQR